MVARWTQRVFCRARRALQKSLWGRPRQTLASGSKTVTFSFDFNFNFNFRAEGRSGDPKFLRQKCSPTPNLCWIHHKNFCWRTPPPPPANFAGGGGGVCNTKVYDIQQISIVYYGLRLYVRIVEPPPRQQNLLAGGVLLCQQIFAGIGWPPRQQNLLAWGVCNTKVYEVAILCEVSNMHINLLFSN